MAHQGLAILAISTIGVCKSGDGQTAVCHSSIMRKILFSTSFVFLVLGASLVRLTWLKDLIDEEGKQLSRLSKTLKVVFTIIIHLVGALAIPYINSWPLRFGIPAICMLVATIIFWRGRFRSSHASTERPKERPVITVLRVLVASFLGTFDKNLTNSAEPNAREDDRSIVRSSHLRCLHRATNYNLSNHNPELEINRWKHCTVEEVEEAKKAICGIPFCIAFFVLGIISSLGDTYFIQQAETMNPMIGNWDVPLQILQLFCLLAKAVIAKSYSKIADKFYGNARSKSAGFHGILISTIFAAL
ncbi:Putative peptide/nitrate transporter [Morus notabilis]|uniref:Putative peptide/nitrate transporter n=1 Tax=Morus notabilis TaxID=981085 RepID=W9R9C2_9ROSA|nr:Putative peptide/nitrate transporter [Morus notabilis]